METIVGFVAGYLAGSRDGQDGAQRLRESLEAIRNSPEARRLAAEGMMYAQVIVRRAASGRSISGLGGTVATITDMISQRASRPSAA